jgi:RNA polymerase sigma-70 factor (ECF subfamily)
VDTVWPLPIVVAVTDAPDPQRAKRAVSTPIGREAADLDAALVARARRGERGAFDELVRRHQQGLWRLVRRYVASDADAADVTQQAFVRAFRALDRFRGDASVRTWLRAIARHVLLERYRSRGREVTLLEVATGSPGPESLAIAAQQRRQLLAALQSLPDDHALVVGLHWIEGLAHAEIADLLEITPESSRKRLQRATARLREILPAVRTGDLRHSRLESWCASLIGRHEEEIQRCQRLSATG